MKVALISPLIKTTPNLGKWKENEWEQKWVP